MNIRHLRQEDIDKKLWDETIMQSQRFVPYALSWYLDIVCPDWEALVADNYEVIMPLPVKRKCGIRYLVEPLWAQKLGIFSRNMLSEETMNKIIKVIPYSIYAFNLNEDNYTSRYCTKQKNTNLYLDLNAPYEALESRYNTNTKRNIKKVQKEEIRVREISADEFMALWLRDNKGTNEHHHRLLSKLIESSRDRGKTVLLGAINKNGGVIAVLFALIFKKRMYYLAPASNAEGKESSAMFMIVDHIIENHAGEDMVLDFEGSMIEGVARFYKGFGAKEEYYYPISRLYPEQLLKNIHKLLS